MKHHYEIMRIMRTKVVNFRDLFEGKQAIVCVMQAVGYRVKDLASVSVSSSPVARDINLINPLSDNFSQQRLDLDKQFQTFAYGIVSPLSPLGRVSLTCLLLQFNHCHNFQALWTVDYIRGLDQKVIPYNDDNEDGDVQPESILNYGCKDELSVDNGMYDGQSIDDIPDQRDIEPPLKDVYVLTCLC